MMSINMAALPTIATDTLDLYANPSDLRRDVHTFVKYVGSRSIKRSYRGNELPTADYKRLAQLLNIREPNGADGEQRYAQWDYAEGESWVDYVDSVALKLGLISYDTQGEYRGYSSNEPSFRENYIVCNVERYRSFLALPIAAQERKLFDTLVDDYNYSHNEFFQRSILGRLDRFSQFGSATGVMPTLNFAAIRRFLFAMLQGCQPGVWYSTAAFIAYVKAEYPFAVIPQQAVMNKFSKLPEKRYGNFYEDSYNRDAIPDDARDGFERIEGRYVERFLEGIPLTLGYIEVAYARAKPRSGLSRGMLPAFRVSERFLQAMRGDIPEPKLTIQPNFEMYIESAFYPAYLIDRLSPFADVVREDTTTILKLQKQKVATQLAENAGLDVVALLRKLSGRDLPQNILVELHEWAGHADVFTLYDGFGLVESADDLAAIDAFTVAKIGATLRLVRMPAVVLTRLHEAEAVVIHIHHAEQGLQPLPEKAQTLFPRQLPVAPIKQKKQKQSVTVTRETRVVLYLPDDRLFEAFRKALDDAHCLIEANAATRMLTIAAHHEGRIKQIIKDLSDEYSIRLEEHA